MRHAALLTCSLAAAHAQSTQTAQQSLRLHVYGMFSYSRSDFRSGGGGGGATVGTNIDGFRVLPFTEIGLDLRAATARAYDIHESTVAGGPRVSYTRYRLQPYAEYMLGIGRGTFPHSTPDYPRDYTAIRDYGGGFDYQVARNFSLRADVQRQRWRFSYTQPYFHPVQASFGINYRVHLPSRTGPQF